MSDLRKKLFNLWIKKKTKNFTRIPLLMVFFDYNKYKKYGKTNSCLIFPHPKIQKDEFIKEKMFEVVDHIRDSYDMDIFTKI